MDGMNDHDLTTLRLDFQRGVPGAAVAAPAMPVLSDTMRSKGTTPAPLMPLVKGGRR
jgi:hypothetical protein